MGRKKIDNAIKIKACKDYESGRGSFKSIGENIGIISKPISEWYYAYKIHGENAFTSSSKDSLFIT